MEEIINEEPAIVSAKPEPVAAPKLSWRAYLDTEEATRVIYLIFGFIAILMVMIYLQKQTDAICCGDWDGYYHIRWSSLLWENFKHGKWLPSFDWLPLTVLNAHSYADHHFLFHLLQIPFLWFFEPVMAAKAATVVYGTLAIFAVYWLLYRYDIKHQLVWLAAILTCSTMFYYRMNMAKAPPLTIIITIAGIYLLFERKYVWLLPLMFAFVWTYSLFPLLLIAAVIWTIIIAWNERRFEWRPIVYAGVGLILGNVINPYFPHNLGLFVEHFSEKFQFGNEFAVAVGGEWYPYNGLELLMTFPIALLAVLIGYILYVPRNGKLPEKATFFLMFVTILLAAQFRSKRFAEYFPPFAILFAAFSWQAFWISAESQLPEDFKREIEPYLDKGKPTQNEVFWDSAKVAAAWVIGIVLTAFFVFNLVGFHYFGANLDGIVNFIRGNEAGDKYQRTMEWATGFDAQGNENIPAGERIFNCNWDDFPKLFFFDQKHSYVYGLDPNYLYSQNPDLYKLLQDITNAKTEDAGPIIREKFGARYVFADAKENEDMIAKGLESGWMDIVYEDDEARILKIRDEKGQPPLADSDAAPETQEEKQQLDEEEKAVNKGESNDDNDDNDNDEGN
jgi:hypothetical protein